MDRQKRVFLQADKSVPYGELMRVMNLLRDAGYLKVALVGLEGIDSPAGDHAAKRTPNTIPSPEPPPASARRP
jgi:biopolymer transport protein ExbD